jgi:hypothetical protein
MNEKDFNGYTVPKAYSSELCENMPYSKYWYANTSRKYDMHVQVTYDKVTNDSLRSTYYPIYHMT